MDDYYTLLIFSLFFGDLIHKCCLFSTTYVASICWFLFLSTESATYLICFDMSKKLYSLDSPLRIMAIYKICHQKNRISFLRK